MGDGAQTLTWYDIATNTAVVLGETCGGACGPHLDATGQKLVYESWGTDLGGEQSVALHFVSFDNDVPTTTIFGQGQWPSIDADGSLVSGVTNNGAFVWNSSTQAVISLPSGPEAQDVMSPDGSTVAVDSVIDQGQADQISEYSATTGALIRTYLPGTLVSIDGLSDDGNEGVGASGNFVYINFADDTMQSIANSWDQECGGGGYSAIAISADGITVAFGSLANKLVPDSAGGSLGYFTYDPSTEQVTNQSGTFSGPPPSGDCPSVAMTSSANQIYFVNYSVPPPGTTDAASVSRGPEQLVSSGGQAITSPNSATATLGQSFSFQVTTSGPPYPAIKEKGKLPAGLSFQVQGQGRARISGKPRNISGFFTLTLTATYSGKNKDTVPQSFLLTVNRDAYVERTSLSPS